MIRATASILLALLIIAVFAAAQPTGDHVILVVNDLGMHCMNRDHHTLSILPPWNTLQAQVILRGDETTPPQIVTTDLLMEYSIPGNTYSAGKTDFWDHVQALFGVDLEPNVGLTGKTLNDVFDVHGDLFLAEGVPITPFTDAAPTIEDPYQQAEVILRDLSGGELARAYPVMPVSTEVNCLTSGCHTSEVAILDEHPDPYEGGIDPADAPVLCASCHGSTPLTGPDPGPHDWFSKVIHEKHHFLDETMPGLDGCQMCHPGPNTRCLRGTMGNDFGMICQDCHGDMEQMEQSIDAGRLPWLDEPACRDCHTAQFGEPVGELYRNARGHGGVLCSGCHNSPHAIFPSREERDNQVMIDLQGHAGTLSDCTVCHRHVPDGPGPHGLLPSEVVKEEFLGIGGALRIYPSPLQAGAGCTIMAASRRADSGRLLVFDVRGRTLRLLQAEEQGDGNAVVRWDGRDGQGRQVPAGVYFLRWDDGRSQAAGKVVVVN